RRPAQLRIPSPMEGGSDMSSPVRVEKIQEAPAAPVAQPRRGRRKVIILVVLAVLAIAAAILGVRTVLFYQHHATTDDAQIEGHIDPVLPRVSGYVKEVLVRENEPV